MVRKVVRQEPRLIPTRANAAKIALGYALIGCIWILWSDRWLHSMVTDRGVDALVSQVKGWFFVLATAATLGVVLDRYFALIRRHVDDLHAAQAALRESEERYRLVSENSTDVIWLFDLAANRFTYVAPSVERMRGFTVAEVLQQTMGDALTEESFRMVAEGLGPRLAAFEAGDDSVRTQTHDVWQTRKDGRIVPTEVVTTLIPRDGRRVALIQGVSRDISERKRAEEALHAREAEFRTMFELASIGIAQADPATGQWTRVNSRMCAITGYSSEEMLGMRVSEITHPDDRQADWERFQAVVSGEQPDYRFEKRYIRKDGTIAWVNVNMTVIRDAEGRPSRSVATVEDITERIAGASALRQSEERFRTLVDNAPMGIFIQIRGRFAYLNRAAAGMFDPGSQGNLLGQPVLDRIHRDYHDTVRARIRQLNEARVPVQEPEERRCVRVDGSEFEAEVSAVPFDYAGDSGALVFFRDTTERRRLESDLRQMQKLEAIGQLAGGVAHDFNNILAAIMMSLGLLRLSPRIDDDARDMVQEIDAQARRAAELTRQLLMFSRRSVLAVGPVDLGAVIADLLKMLRRLIGEQIDVRFERKSGLPLVHADAGMIEQVLVNLAVNARDAMPRGGRITIATAVVDVGAAAAARHNRPPGRFVCLAVADTGTGIAEPTLKRMFEPFFTTKEAGKGTGLGLATVHGIVAQHDGWVEVESEVGRGSTFRVFLPALDGPVSSAQNPSVADAQQGGHETVLLVEDEAAVRRLASRALKALGYEVLEASNGQEALSVWAQHGPCVDLLFTDMVMPEGMTGVDLIERLRATKPELRVILSSGYSADIVHSGAPVAPGVMYLPKPYDATSLGAAVRRSLGGDADRGATV